MYGAERFKRDKSMEISTIEVNASKIFVLKLVSVRVAFNVSRVII